MQRSSKLVLVAVFACGGDRTPPTEPPRNVGGDTCVLAPDASYLRGAPLGTVKRGTAPDLDGDGRPEYWVTAQGLCGGSGNCVYTIFDGATCRAIGIVGASGFAPRMVAGGRGFIAVEQDMNAVLEARYAWTRDEYVPVAVRLCLTREDPTCRQCKPWQALSGARYPVDDASAGWPVLSASLGPATACDPRE